MDYQTNIVVDKHNAWTLTKHLVQSANKQAAKLDAKIYGTKTNVVIVALMSGKMKWHQMLP